MKTYFIVPVYNVEKYLQRCIDSIFCQTDQDFIAIFINDGSTDNSLSILENENKKRENMLIINKTNGGLSSARNAGLKAIKNINDSLITFVDSDDYIDKHFLKNLKTIMNEYNADIVCSLYRGLNSDGTFCRKKVTEGKDLKIDRFHAMKLLLGAKLKCHSPTKLYKGYLWNNTFFDENISFLEDQYLTPCIFDKANVIVKTFYHGYFYQHHSSSLCGSKMTPNKINDSLLSYIFLYNNQFSFEKRELKKLKKIIVSKFYQIYLMMFPRIDCSQYNESQLIQLSKINAFVKEHSIIFGFHPTSFKEFLKKIIFVFSKKLYLKIYKRYLGVN